MLVVNPPRDLPMACGPFFLTPRCRPDALSPRSSPRTAQGWSAPAFVSVGGGSLGFQIGLQGVDLVMLVMNDQGFQHLLSSKFQLSGDASAAAGPVGRHASAGTDWKMNAEILTYSRARGVFAGLPLNGADAPPDEDSMHTEYGPDVTFRSVLSGSVPPPSGSHAFLEAV